MGFHGTIHEQYRMMPHVQRVPPPEVQATTLLNGTARVASSNVVGACRRGANGEEVRCVWAAAPAHIDNVQGCACSSHWPKGFTTASSAVLNAWLTAHSSLAAGH